MIATVAALSITACVAFCAGWVAAMDRHPPAHWSSNEELDAMKAEVEKYAVDADSCRQAMQRLKEQELVMGLLLDRYRDAAARLAEIEREAA